ncbi:MAG: serine O-acetyltransferase EpsC [Vampirovibrionales bacterium]
MPILRGSDHKHNRAKNHLPSKKVPWKLLFAIAALPLVDITLLHGKGLATLSRGKLPFLKAMSEDIDHILTQDGYATRSKLEALLCIPGLHAVWMHRIAHQLYQWQVPVLPRLIANVSRILTGIEIHPGAYLGKHVFFDHSGAIVGQTAHVGDRVKVIGRVCLGANGKQGFLRHTIVKPDATLGMNATMLGRITIGEGATVGAGAVITKDIPPHTTVIGMGHQVQVTSAKGYKLPQPIALKQYLALNP